MGSSRRPRQACLRRWRDPRRNRVAIGKRARTRRAVPALLLLGVALAGCQQAIPVAGSPVTRVATTPSRSPTAAATEGIPADSPSPSATPSVSAPLPPFVALVEELEVAPEHLNDYDRDLFPLWTDEDGDGCNTRYEVLLDEAVVAPTVSGSCDLTGGTWVSPYDGVRIDGAAGVQIDHLVALAEAWYSGAWAWSTGRREAFANDLALPGALNAVSPTINEEKGSDDPAEWLPPESDAVCPYVEAWIASKARWMLAVDPAERDALVEWAVSCS